MSSLQYANKRYTLQFTIHGKRKTWRLGRLDGRTASSFKFNVESMAESLNIGQKLNKSVLAWIDGLVPLHRTYLTSQGLIEAKESAKLGEFLDFAMDNHYRNSAANTVRNMANVKNRLISRFGKNTDIGTITKGDIEVWKNDLFDERHSDANIASYLKKTRRFFNLAVDHEVIEKTPFKGVLIPSEVNADRVFYVGPKSIDSLLAVCNVTWKGIVSLCRYSGMRCPSDVTSLKWSSVDFGRKRIAQYRQKTSRTVEIPMQPEVESALLALRDITGDTKFVFPPSIRLASSGSIYNQLKARVIKAGLTPWPRLTTNLRVSMGVDWKNAGISHSTYSVWLDHNESVQKKHYECVSDVEFDRAVSMCN